MFDVHRGDVVGEQHHFVAVQFVGNLCGNAGRADLAHHAQDEVARAHEGIEDMDALVGEGAVELTLENVFDGAHHKVHDGLRRVHDAVRIGHFDREALEKLLVDGVEEALLLRVILDGGGGLLDRAVEAVQGPEKIVAAEVVRGQGLDDLLDLCGRWRCCAR